MNRRVVKLNLIAAVCANNGIGKDNSLLFKIPDDQKFFHDITVGKTVIMGRKTYQSLPDGKALPDRKNIVLSTRPDFKPSDCLVCQNLDILHDIIASERPDDVFVIGGAEIYKLLLHDCNRAFITQINASPDCDSFFPELNNHEWHLITSSLPRVHNATEYKLSIYERI